MRRDIGDSRAALVLFWAALAAYPAFVFQPSAILVLGEAVAFCVIAKRVRGRLRILPAVAMVAGIALFNLLAPVGRVFARIGEVPLTIGALELGLRKGAILAGMVQLSRIAVSRDLRLPGKTGSFLAKVFHYFDLITAFPIKPKEGNLIAQIDDAIMRVYNDEALCPKPDAQRLEGLEKDTQATGVIPIQTRPRIALFLLAVIPWALLLLGRITPSLEELLRSAESLRP